jgi:imidazolonepropionase-like amidohydrolase
VQIGSGPDAVPAGVDVVDLSRYTAIPGLIDVHTHMTYYWDRRPGTTPWRQGGSRTVEETVALAAVNARLTLETGVTTVRDLGASNHADILLRDRIARGEIIGPRMFVSAYGLQRTRAAQQTPAQPGTPPATQRGRVAGLADVHAAVQAQVDAGAGVIKMYGSSGSGADVTGRQTFSFEEMKAAVDAAHQLHRRIAIHSYGPEGARDAVRAGAESVEHAVDIDDETLAEMARRGIVYVPTWFSQIGMSPAQALATATTIPAALLGMEQRLGRLATGYEADIVALDGNPLEDFDVVFNGVRWVMKAGRVVVDRTN